MSEMRENMENCALNDNLAQNNVPEETLKSVLEDLNRIGQENQEKISSSASIDTSSRLDASILEKAKLSILKVLAPIIDSR